VYGARQPVSWPEQESHLAELAVGRLVERSQNMTAVIDVFLDSGGMLTVTQSLVAGYDFMQDAMVLGGSYLDNAENCLHATSLNSTGG